MAAALPVAAPLVAGETVTSYVRRLAEANEIDPRDLVRHLGDGWPFPRRTVDQPRANMILASHRGNRHPLPPTPLDAAFEDYDLALNDAALHRLAAAGGHPAGQLAAVLGLPAPGSKASGPDPAWRFTKLRRDQHTHLACTHCATRRGITSRVVVRLALARIVCITHARWVANPPYGIHPDHDYRLTQQIDLRALPEIIAAARRCQRLIRRHGDTAVYDAFRGAHLAITTWGAKPADELVQRWQHRQQRAGRTIGQPTLTHLTHYPETVAWTGLLLSAGWQAAARRISPRDAWLADLYDHWHGEGPARPHHEDFRAEALRRLGLPMEQEVINPAVGNLAIEANSRRHSERVAERSAATRRI